MPLFILILIKLNVVSLNNYVWLPLKISTIYLICVMGIFLTNHASLSSMLEFTTRRITMPIMMMLFIFNLMILKELNVFYKVFESSRHKFIDFRQIFKKFSKIFIKFSIFFINNFSMGRNTPLKGNLETLYL